MLETLIGIAVGFGAAALIWLLYRKAKPNILEGSEHVGEAVKEFAKDTAFLEKYGHIIDIALDLVEGAEQLKRAGKIDSKEAKMMVKESLKQILKEMGQELPDTVVDLIVESAVFSVNFFLKEEGQKKE